MSLKPKKNFKFMGFAFSGALRVALNAKAFIPKHSPINMRSNGHQGDWRFANKTNQHLAQQCAKFVRPNTHRLCLFRWWKYIL